MDERFARVVRLELAEHLDPVRGDHPAWASSPAAAAVASSARQQAGPGRYWLLIAAAIAAVTLATTILLAGGFRLPDLPSLPWLISESPEPTMPDASPGPTPTPEASPEPMTDPNVFSWARDGLREWVTEAELTEAIAAMASRGTFPAPLDGDVMSECDVAGYEKTRLEKQECVWSFRLAGDDESWRILVHNGDHDGDGVADAGGRAVLRDGVRLTYAQGEGFAYAAFVFSGPHTTQSICLTLLPPGMGTLGVDVNEVGYKARVFDLASMMLLEMGWTEETAGEPTVFSWARDDLSEWVTEDEVTAAIVGMSMKRPFGADLDGTVEAECTEKHDATGRKGQECAWTFRLAEGWGSWRLTARNGDLDGDGVPERWGRTARVDGVRVTYGEYRPGFIFYPADDAGRSIFIILSPPGAINDDWRSEVGYKGRAFDLALMILRELGWVD